MTTVNSLVDFAENLQQETLTLAATEELSLGDAFTQIVFDMLSDAGEFEDPTVCYHRHTGMEVSGFVLDQDEGRLDLFLSIHTSTVPPETVTRGRVDVAFRRLRSFLEWCMKGRYRDLEESSPQFDMASLIYQSRGDLSRVRLTVLTNGRTTVATLPEDSLDGIPLSLSLWDVVRIQRLSTSGQQRGTISVDLASRCGLPLPCLQADTEKEGYRAFLTLFPGDVLRGIYADYGARLLERNVRSFLQATGKVNRGIRDTILNQPERFLAYNNGITLTAEAVHLSTTGNALSIERIEGLQIVNGGQTTASLLATASGRADLSEVYVAAKLIEIAAGAEHDELVRSVSQYANTQNRITGADFSANDPFHVQLEELSRTTWAPAVGGTQKQTKWFYERARGQYQNARRAERTNARRTAFLAENPPEQRFSKTDIAKFENTWDQRPFIVSRGAQKNFSDFTIRLSERGQAPVDRPYYERLVAKAILFRSADRIVQRQEFGGYRAQIVTYTLALIAHATTQTLDLERIWREQSLSTALQETIGRLSHEVQRVITEAPGGRNISEWCKDMQCWEAVRRKVTVDILDGIRSELLSAEGRRREHERDIASLPSSYVEDLTRIVALSSVAWQTLATWGAETKSLAPNERKLAIKVGRYLGRGRTIPSEEAEKAAAILTRAEALGFRLTAE